MVKQRPMSATMRTLRVLSALMLREMTTRYGRSAGGYIWAVLEPVGMILILSFAFSQFLRTPPVGESFVLFYATGYLPFHYFAEISNTTSSAVSTNRSLLHLPLVTPLDTILARFWLSFLTLIVVSAVVLFGLAYLYSETLSVDLEGLIRSFGAGAVLGIGIGTLNALIFPFVPVWRQIWGIISRPLFLISGIFFVFEELPEPLQALLYWNPLIHVVGASRKAFFPTYDGTYVNIGYAYAVGILAFLIGAALLVRHRSFVIEATR